jgi:biotin operon repressor
MITIVVKTMRKVTQVDLETGEDLGGFVAVVRPKQKSAFERHFTMNQAALELLAKTLTGEQFKVLMMLLASLDYENFIQVAQADIAEKLEMQKTNISRSVKSLIDLGVILEGPKIGRSKSYRLNPHFGWKGTVNNHKKALRNGLSVIDGGIK